MPRDAQVFDRFRDADAASRKQYAAMTPEARLALVFELARRHHEDRLEAAPGLARVYRVAQLDRR
jgi:hypothetical protein